jgi:hypothetical protein
MRIGALLAFNVDEGPVAAFVMHFVPTSGPRRDPDALQGDARAILHVEAEETLRGTGAAGRFMQGLADHARAAGITLKPRCGYAVAWFKRHPDQADVLG